MQHLEKLTCETKISKSDYFYFHDALDDTE